MLLLLDKISPKYLNSFTDFTFFFSIFKVPTLFTYIAFVFLTFIESAFSLQNCTKQSVRSYNSSGLGATRTKSSAKASKNNCNDAIVYALRLLPFMFLSL